MYRKYEPAARRAALTKVREGARLLAACDYTRAIAACTEALRLDPTVGDADLFASEARRLRERGFLSRALSGLDSGAVALVGQAENPDSFPP